MKRFYLTGLAMMAILSLHAQGSKTDSSAYRNRKLRIEEINLVSSYYKQDGDHAAVTGGSGSEALTDLANTLEIKLAKYSISGKKKILSFEGGVDHYTSASSDMIDLSANSSASSADNRFYPSLTYIIENEDKGTSVGMGISSSTEYDYQSFGGNLTYSKKTNDRNGEIAAKFQAFLDQVRIIRPVELRGIPGQNNGTVPRNTFATTISYSRIVNPELQFMIIGDVVVQDGYLSLPFHRTYFSDGTVRQEKLPGSRIKFPIGIRGSFFPGSTLIIKGYYRYYFDTWDLRSHTASVEIPVKINPFFSVIPFYRYYKQNNIKYFKPYGLHDIKDSYYTSNYDLSDFGSNFAGMGIKLTPLKGVFGIKHFHTLELRYGHYLKSNDMVADILSMSVKIL